MLPLRLFNHLVGAGLRQSEINLNNFISITTFMENTLFYSLDKCQSEIFSKSYTSSNFEILHICHDVAKR